MKIIEEEKERYMLVYEDEHRCGYAFPCDKQGAVLSSTAAAKKNLAVAKAKKWTGKNGEVVTFVAHSRYGICPGCGRKIYLNGDGYFGAFACECGKWYNRFGQELKDPKSWDWDDDRDGNLYDDLYNDWIDDSYQYWYEGCDDDCDDDDDWDREWYEDWRQKWL